MTLPTLVPFTPSRPTNPPQKMGLYAVVRTELAPLVMAPVTLSDAPEIAPADDTEAYTVGAGPTRGVDPDILRLVHVATPVWDILEYVFNDEPSTSGPLVVTVPHTISPDSRIAQTGIPALSLTVKGVVVAESLVIDSGPVNMLVAVMLPKLDDPLTPRLAQVTLPSFAMLATLLAPS